MQWFMSVGNLLPFTSKQGFQSVFVWSTTLVQTEMSGTIRCIAMTCGKEIPFGMNCNNLRQGWPNIFSCGPHREK